MDGSQIECTCTKLKGSVYGINVFIWFKIHFINILLKINAYKYYTKIINDIIIISHLKEKWNNKIVCVFFIISHLKEKWNNKIVCVFFIHLLRDTLNHDVSYLNEYNTQFSLVYILVPEN